MLWTFRWHWQGGVDLTNILPSAGKLTNILVKGRFVRSEGWMHQVQIQTTIGSPKISQVWITYHVESTYSVKIQDL